MIKKRLNLKRIFGRLSLSLFLFLQYSSPAEMVVKKKDAMMRFTKTAIAEHISLYIKPTSIWMAIFNPNYR